ncbi:ABC transporter permease [Paenibacillus nasutitermitis]|uniref:Sugar ABC transporter permease n=1 Tax=Paenibacillus nasutitermitis TaxID=1652958 RepID=A0A916ZJV0_9BACL|nr:ABC transporter permease subunit [Paenibacillus nasutitermitis]GGE01457.1 sugar ABC transporter permease [Paenibacillus nasutitermitis]
MNRANKLNKKMRKVAEFYQLYLMIFPALAYILIFHYVPMYGLQIAFKDFRNTLGFKGSPWVGLKHFERFFELPSFWNLIANTVLLNLYELAVGFPIPIILALLINEAKNKMIRKSVQMITYAPHFISVVVMSGMIMLFLNNERGMVNHFIEMLGGFKISFMSDPGWFKTVYVFSGVWQNAGWGTIIYLAALSGIDPQQIEASKIDGANRLQKIWHIDLPGIAPTILILLILVMGNMFSIGFEKILLLQNQLNIRASDVISTYVYRLGILGGQFSYTTAIGLFNAVLNFLLLIFVNAYAKKRTETSLW